MINSNHPITPPPELVHQWVESTRAHDSIGAYAEDYIDHVATQAARWGADEELKACCLWVAQESRTACRQLKAHRRPKPPSLKERGREALQNIHAAVVMETGGRELDVLKEIVESLPD